MFDLTPDQAEPFKSASLTWYAQLLDRHRQGRATFRPDDFGLSLRSMQERMHAIRQSGLADFRPVPGQPGAYELVFPHLLAARELLARYAQLGLAWPSLTAELLAGLLERHPAAGDRIEEILLSARAAEVEDAHLPKYLVTSLRSPRKSRQLPPEDDPAQDAYYTAEAIAARARRWNGAGPPAPADPADPFSPAYWTADAIAARQRTRAAEEAQAREQPSRPA